MHQEIQMSVVCAQDSVLWGVKGCGRAFHLALILPTVRLCHSSLDTGDGKLAGAVCMVHALSIPLSRLVGHQGF